MPKAESAFSRVNRVEDTTIGWRFVNRLMKERYGVDSMPETAEQRGHRIQDRTRSPGPHGAGFAATGPRQRRSARLLRRRRSCRSRYFRRRARRSSVAKDEHPRDTSLEALAKLKGVVRPDGTVTAGNASGVNDGACALLLASETAASRHGLTPRARVGMATAGVPPRIMGMGPAPATRKVLALTGLTLAQLDLIERRVAPPRPRAWQFCVTWGCATMTPASTRTVVRLRWGHPLGASGAAGDDGNQPAPCERPLCAGHDVHRCWPGHRGRSRTRLASRPWKAITSR